MDSGPVKPRLWLRMALPLLAGLILFWISRHSYLLFHTLVEMISIAVAGGVFMVAWNTRQFNQFRFISFLGAAYLSVAAVDLLHVLAYQGMNIFQDRGPNLATQLWIAARYMESLALLTAAATAGRRWSISRATIGFGLIGAVLATLIFSGRFPDCYLPEQGLTGFKIISEYIIILLLFAVIFAAYARRDRFPADSFGLLVWSCLLSIAGELSLTLYVDVYGLLIQVGHYFKLVSFYLIYLAAIEVNLKQPYQSMFADLKLSEEAARRSEALLNRTQALARVGGWEWDVAADRFLATVEAHRLLGFEPARPLVYTDLLDLVPTDERPKVEAALNRSLEQGLDHDIEFPLITAQGDHIWIRQQVRVESAPGRSPRLIGFIQNITELKQAQQLRDDVERMTAHDLRTPLNAVINLPHMIIDDPEADETHREIAEMIHESGVNLLRQLDQTLCVYKMEQSEAIVQRSPVDLIAAVNRTVRDLKSWMEYKNIKLAVELNGRPVDRDSRLTVPVDGVLIQVALTNMLKNALEASPGDQTVTVELTSDRAGGAIAAVRNRGAVPREIRETFFDKYVSAGKTKGAGLGTYSVYLIARAHGGEATLEAGEEETRVLLHLPGPEEPPNC